MSTHNENLAQNLGANSNLKPNLNPNSNSSPKALPKTWQSKTLGEVCTSHNSNIKFAEIKEQKGDYPIYGASGIAAYVNFFVKEKQCLGVVKDGAGVGRVFLLPEKASVIGTLHYVENNEFVDIKYLFYFLQSVNLSKYLSGTAIPHIYFRDYKKEKIPLPPTMEIQRQIVQRLDAAFEKIDKAVARLKSAKSNLTRYKQSLLKAAFNGTLTKSPHATWQSKTLGEILDYEQPSKYIVKSTKYDDSFQTPVLTAGKSFILGYTDEKDGIFTQIPVIIFDDFTTATKFVDFEFKVKSSAMKILHAKENADIKFVFYYMQTIHHRSDTHKRYWIGEYSKHKILLPPLQTQKEIVQILERHFEGADRTEKFIDSALKRAKMLKQSLLKVAFEGALVQ